MALALFNHIRVLVRGGGDLASGVIYRLVRAGFPVLVTELPAPILVRRAVCFGDAVYTQQLEVEGIRARLVEEIPAFIGDEVPVIVDEGRQTLLRWQPHVVVDARMEKVSPDTRHEDDPLAIALGPGYSAGLDCHAVIETNRGHRLGRVIWDGPAEANTGEPGAVGGKTFSRVLRAPIAGHVLPSARIGDMMVAGQCIATIGDLPLLAPFDGVLRGLIHERVLVEAGMKIGDLDPRARVEHCFEISDKSL